MGEASNPHHPTNPRCWSCFTNHTLVSLSFSSSFPKSRVSSFPKPLSCWVSSRVARRNALPLGEGGNVTSPGRESAKGGVLPALLAKDSFSKLNSCSCFTMLRLSNHHRAGSSCCPQSQSQTGRNVNKTWCSAGTKKREGASSSALLSPFERRQVKSISCYWGRGVLVGGDAELKQECHVSRTCLFEEIFLLTWLANKGYMSWAKLRPLVLCHLGWCNSEWDAWDVAIAQDKYLELQHILQTDDTSDKLEAMVLFNVWRMVLTASHQSCHRPTPCNVVVQVIPSPDMGEFPCQPEVLLLAKQRPCWAKVMV